uniref:carboxypeptidase-like regulatory domain-containing protein n=1 Tax=Mesoflavibacter zeaxanthinifaciens TaxID=393060 RepID=UPI0026F0B2C4
MKNLLPILTLFLLTNLALAQNGTVSGTVKDNNQAPLFGVNVSLKNTNKGTQTNENGEFEISNLENGDYTLLISYLGFKTREIQLSVLNNQNKNLETITLYEGNEILSEVIVEGERRNKFSRKKTAYVSKLPLKDIENTQVYSTVTNEILKSQIVTNFDD